MYKIGVFFTKIGKLDYPLNKSTYYTCYNELSEAINSKGGSFYIVRGKEQYRGDGTFSNSWQFDGLELRETGQVKLDVIFDKGNGSDLIINDGTPVLNSKKVNEICVDKWLTYKLLESDCPKTFLVNSSDQFQKALKLIDSSTVVIKPVDGECGIGVVIGSKINALSQIHVNAFPMLVQEFIDSSSGIPNIVSGIHDLRVVILDGMLQYAFVRSPQSGGLKANVALGGTLKQVDLVEIPKLLLELVERVDNKMAMFGSRMYSIDMAMTKTKPLIIELNSRFGLEENSTHPDFARFTQRLAEKLISLAC